MAGGDRSVVEADGPTTEDEEARSTTGFVYSLEITAPEWESPVRTLAVPGTFTLDDLHLCIEIAFARPAPSRGRYWFSIDGRRLLSLDPELDPEDERVADAEFTRIDDLHLVKGAHFDYRPDFLAPHAHRVVIEAIRSAGDDALRPRCLDARGFASGPDVGPPHVAAIDAALAAAFPSLARCGADEEGGR